ncbi:uncharacterized protein At1g28695-like [Prosopis cineraria]|uniref:uncharacterized protein At1g28695-like n=1 Tax=Prosopis cineraria TaxID=364024 RepID=UPI00240F172E|nr:uncharacterized protein At1g28695-like [Prosopis cineraria]
MDQYRNQTPITNLVFSSLLVASAFLFLLSFPFSHPLLSLHHQHHHHPPSSSWNLIPNSSAAIDVAGGGDGLDAALARASLGKKEKTVIITVINKAYAEADQENTSMLDLFLESFWVGEGTRPLVDHVLFVAIDQTAYERCQFRRLICFRLETDGGDSESEKLYMSSDFIEMMWTRTLFLLQVLKRGYGFVFTDTDIMWLRNPFTRLSKNKSEDFQISTDKYLRNPWSERHLINTGFYFIRSNNKTISLFETWYSKKDNSTGQKEQDVLLDLIAHDGIFGELGLRVRFLDTLYFSGFCEDSKDLRVVTTVHANCCRSIAAKVADLTIVLRDWKRFKKISEKGGNLTANYQWTGHFRCWKSWNA